MNWQSALAIYANEITRFFRTVFGSILSPVLTTSLYFIVFGAAIGSLPPEARRTSSSGTPSPVRSRSLSSAAPGTSSETTGRYPRDAVSKR